MKAQTDVQLIPYEQALANIVRTLPPERAAQLVDFGRFLRSLGTKPHGYDRLTVEKADERARVGEEKWERLLATPEAQRALVDMAREARADFHGGRTTDIIVTPDGRLAPP